MSRSTVEEEKLYDLEYADQAQHPLADMVPGPHVTNIQGVVTRTRAHNIRQRKVSEYIKCVPSPGFGSGS